MIISSLLNLQNSQNWKIDIKVTGRIYESFKVIQEIAASSAMNINDQEINAAVT